MTAQGKGSTRRPQQVSDEVMAENWERVFGETTWAWIDEEIDVESFLRTHRGGLSLPSSVKIARASFSVELDPTLLDDMLIMKGKP